MKYKNKEYKTIIWDWKSTLYDAFDNKLFDWVLPFFKNLDTQNYLVSWSNSLQKRLEIIRTTGMEKYFKEILVSSISKKEVFEEIFDKEGVKPETTLIVGDNMNDEIRFGRELGIESVHISEFVREVVKKNK